MTDSRHDVKSTPDGLRKLGHNHLTPEDAHRTRLLHTIGLLLCGAGFLFLVTQLSLWIHPAFPKPPWGDLLLDGLMIVAGLLTLWFVRSSLLQPAAWVVLGLMLLGSAVHLFLEGKPVADLTGKPSLLLTVAVGFVLLERRDAWVVLGASAAIVVGMHALWWAGLLPEPIPRDPFGQLLFSLAGWITIATILAAVTYSTMRVLRHQTRALRARVSELTLLHNTGERITRMLELDTLLETAAESLHRSFGYDSAAILTSNEEQRTLSTRALAGRVAKIVPLSHTQALDEGLMGWAARHVETVLVNDVAADPRYLNYYPEHLHTNSELCVPIRTGDNVLGVLDVQSDRRDAFNTSDVMALETLAGQIASVMENARLYQAERDAHQQVRDLVTYLQNAREEERTHIAREILDEFGQLMTALQMELSWLTSRLPDHPPDLTEKTEAMSNVIDESLKVVRRLSSQLRPSVLDHFGLAAAIRWQAETFSERTSIPHQLYLDGAADLLDRKLSTALFRILQESLTNVEHHADATAVHIELIVDPDRATLVVTDDGCGITPEQLSGPRSMGLAGIRQRAEALCGQVTIEGLPGQSTVVTASIPRTHV